MSKHKVPLWGNTQKFTFVDPDATPGATVGVNLFWSDGSIVTEDELRTPGAASSGDFSVGRVRAATVADSITDGVIDVAPSQNAVYDAIAALTAAIAAIPTGTPTLIAAGTTFTVPLNYQVLFARDIDAQGMLVVDGDLIEVD